MDKGDSRCQHLVTDYYNNKYAEHEKQPNSWNLAVNLQEL